MNNEHEDSTYDDIKGRLQIMATAGEVAEVLRCSRQTVYKLYRTNKLGACRLGRSLRFTNMEVALFVSRNTTEPGDEDDRQTL